MPLLHSRRTVNAHGPVVGYDKDDLAHLARCNAPDRDQWSSDHMGSRLWAAHQCIAHCPMLVPCHRQAAQHEWHGMTVGGVVYGHDGQPLDVEADPWQCKECRPRIRRRLTNAVAHPSVLKLCERCGREFMAEHASRRQCRTEECERARWRESRARGRAELFTTPSTGGT